MFGVVEEIVKSVGVLWSLSPPLRLDITESWHFLHFCHGNVVILSVDVVDVDVEMRCAALLRCIICCFVCLRLYFSVTFCVWYFYRFIKCLFFLFI